MAFTRMGFGGTLTFDNSQAVRAMTKSRDDFGQFVRTVDRTSPALRRMGAVADQVLTSVKDRVAKATEGVKQLGGALRGAAVATGIATIALTAGVSQAASFEKQMSAVGAITGATGAEFTRLQDKAKQMGIVSTFSASESAQAMEYMARAGATSDQIISGLSGVMNAAAADGMDLASASNYVSQIVKGMGLTFSDTSHVADVLALTSARSNTNIAQLGEAFRYAAPQARTMGISVEQLSAYLGKMADAGLQGSIGGTSLTNMLVKLNKPSTKAADMMRKWGIRLTDVHGQLRPLHVIVNDFNKRLSRIPDVTKRGAAMTELFGIRGQKAFAALAAAGMKNTGELQSALEQSSKVTNEAGEVVGAAALMAERRLDNLLGRLKLFFSSVEAFTIELFGPMLKPLADNVKYITDQFNKVLFAIQLIKREGFGKGLTKATEQYGRTTASIAAGVVDAIKWMQAQWTKVVDLVRRAGEWLEKSLGSDKIRMLTKFAIIAGVVAGALGPVLIALTGIGAVISMVVVPAISGLIAVVSNLWPLLLVFVAIAAAIQAMRRENESYLDAAMRLWTYVKAAALDVWNTAIKPLWEGMKDGAFILDELKFVWNETVEVFKQSFLDMMATFQQGTDQQEVNWREVGRTIASVLGAVLIAIMKVVQFFAWAGSKLMPIIHGHMIEPIKMWWRHLGFVWSAITDMFSGNILRGLSKLGVALLDTILIPIRLIITNLIKLADMLGMGGRIPNALRTFVKQGLAGTLFKEFAVKEAPAGRPTEPRRRVRVPGARRAREPMAAPITFGADFGESISKELGDLTVTDKTAAASSAEAAKRAAEAAKRAASRKCPDVNVHSKLSVDGRTLAKATSKHQQEVSERTGFKTTPWARRRAAELAAAPTGG